MKQIYNQPGGLENPSSRRKYNRVGRFIYNLLDRRAGRLGKGGGGWRGKKCF